MKKPAHAEVVELVLHPVICFNGCGLYYVSPNWQETTTDVCPDCKSPPKPWAIGAKDLVEVVVQMAFGNVSGVQFLRSLGPAAEHLKVSRRPLMTSLVTDLSAVTVTSKE